MDLPAVQILLLSHGDLSLEEHTQRFLDLHTCPETAFEGHSRSLSPGSFFIADPPLLSVREPRPLLSALSSLLRARESICFLLFMRGNILPVKLKIMQLLRCDTMLKQLIVLYSVVRYTVNKKRL